MRSLRAWLGGFGLPVAFGQLDRPIGRKARERMAMLPRDRAARRQPHADRAVLHPKFLGNALRAAEFAYECLEHSRTLSQSVG